MFARFAIVLVLLVGSAVATDVHADTMLMDTYIVTPLPGQRGPLEQAIHDHLNFRLSKGDSRTWLLYTPTLGRGIGRLMLFHCCASWEELERYQSWETEAETTPHWMNFVEPFVDSVDHFISEVDLNSSNWEGVEKPSPYLNVNELHIRAGHSDQARIDVLAISNYAKAMDWLPRWMWSWQLGGDPVLNLVIPQDRLSDMSFQTNGFEKALGDHMGDKVKARELIQSWNGHFEYNSFQLFKLLRVAEPGQKPDEDR
ncbi:hypothetical protein KUV89_01390 [Marinobacter hydrocarbonoclasticus]|nr:hypothetical protein [Marinobacter nauticus]